MNPTSLESFPDTQYHADARLVTWHPRGVLDDELLDRVADFVELEEQIADAPFNRFTDFDQLTDIRLKIGHVFQVTGRRGASYVGAPVKSALCCKWVVGFGIARLYEELMKGAAIEVRAFHHRKEAADWLGVSEEILLP
jgi:hypothetical protein